MIPQASPSHLGGSEALTEGGTGLYLQHLSPWDTEAGRANKIFWDTAAKLNS